VPPREREGWVGGGASEIVYRLRPGRARFFIFSLSDLQPILAFMQEYRLKHLESLSIRNCNSKNELKLQGKAK
jgi:hypothetical protein